MEREKQQEWENYKQKKIELFKKELSFFLGKLEKIRSNRIPLDVIRGMTIEQKGKKIPIKEIADLKINSNYQMIICCHNNSYLPLVSKTIINSNMGLKMLPNSNKEESFFSLDIISEESKKKLIKEIEIITENAKINFRKIREELRTFLRKNKNISKNQKINFETEADDLFKENQKRIIEAEKKKINDLLS